MSKRKEDFVAELSKFAKRMLPGSRLDEHKASETRIIAVDSQTFRWLDERFGSGDSGESLAVCFEAISNKGLGTAMGIEQFRGKRYGVVVNAGAVGNGRGQEPEENVDYAVLHELTEVGVISPPKIVSEIAHSINRRVEETKGISPETRSRFSTGHLIGVGSECLAALNKGRSAREGLLEAGRLHKTAMKAQAECYGPKTVDRFVHLCVLKRLINERE